MVVLAHYERSSAEFVGTLIAAHLLVPLTQMVVIGGVIVYCTAFIFYQLTFGAHHVHMCNFAHLVSVGCRVICFRWSTFEKHRFAFFTTCLVPQVIS